MTTAAEIAYQLDLTESGNGFVGQCPCCGYERAFSVREEDGHLLVHCHVGCTQKELIKSLCEYELWPEPNAAQIFAEANGAPRRVRKQSTVDAALEIWNRSKPAEGTVVETYLRARGYRGPIPPSLRCVTGKHPADEQMHPVMVAAAVCIGKDRQITGVHRSFLKADGSGKAPLEPAKMTLGKVRGAVVPLAPVGSKLAVSEGIETGLSVQQATGIPTWAALSAGGMATFDLPDEVTDVFIAADPDAVGLKAAEAAAWRWIRKGRRIRIIKPPEGMDFNDLARKSS